jgi:hypothetical protein
MITLDLPETLEKYFWNVVRDNYNGDVQAAMSTLLNLHEKHGWKEQFVKDIQSVRAEVQRRGGIKEKTIEEGVKRYREHREVAQEDVLAAWVVLENLAVSFDQIGAVVGQAKVTACSPEQQHALQEALASYITPALVQAINEARLRLGRYIPDEEAEALSERIAYWDYASLSKGEE